MRPPILAVAAVLLLAGPALAKDVSRGDLTVSEAVMRASLGRVPNTAGYFVVRNAGRTADRLVGASCACAARVELHTHAMEGGVARMRQVPSLAVPAGGELRFAQGAHHLMIMGLKQPARAGTALPVVLRFERAGAVTAPFMVSATAGAQPAAGGHDHHHYPRLGAVRLSPAHACVRVSRDDRPAGPA